MNIKLAILHLPVYQNAFVHVHNVRNTSLNIKLVLLIHEYSSKEEFHNFKCTNYS